MGRSAGRFVVGLAVQKTAGTVGVVLPSGGKEQIVDSEVRTKRDELLYSLLKGDCRLHLGLVITYGTCAITSIVFLVLIVAWHKGLVALAYDVSMGLAFAGAAVSEIFHSIRNDPFVSFAWIPPQAILLRTALNTPNPYGSPSRPRH